MSDKLPILPWPREVQPEEGVFHFATLRIGATEAARLTDLTNRLAGRVQRRFGKRLLLERDDADCNLRFSTSSVLPGGAFAESYEVDVSPDVIDIRAMDLNGFRYALETLLQLVNADADGFTIPCVHIRDHPRFGWRGLLLDPVRHWLPVSVVKQTLEGMAVVKLNVLHWHLTDDQAFRIECETFPRLHQISSRGEFYSVRDVAEVVRFASTLGIRVVPEFDVPGHATSWVAAYPHLGCRNQAPPLQDRFGIFDTLLNPARESTYDFLDRFFAEMAGKFPDDYLHIGGDEVNGREWCESAEVSAYMISSGAPTAAQLQAQFTARVCDIVHKYGKRPIAWEEGASTGATAQTYKTAEAAFALRAVGSEVIVSHGFYLDVMRTAAEHYAVSFPNPNASAGGEVATGVATSVSSGVIGGEACLWSEFVTDENITSRLWPRLGAIAERLWSQAEVMDEGFLYERLDALSDHLRSVGIDFRRDIAARLARIVPPQLLEPVVVLTEVMEPVKDYARVESGKYDIRASLNRLVDVIPPESPGTRVLEGLVSRGQMRLVTEFLGRIAAAADVIDQALIDHALVDTPLAEIVPLTQRLGRLARIGCVAASRPSGNDGSDTVDGMMAGLMDGESIPIAELVSPLASIVAQIVKSVS